MSEDNLKIWDAVQQTDPKYTKGFSKGGGFKGTAINATYQLKRATELWGPLGKDWGYEIVNSAFVPGGGGDIIHVLQIEFRHPSGSFPAFGQTTFVGTNKNGQFTDEEAPKKSLTDAITKALSMLGFSADVFLGLYDDNKYVNDLRQKMAATVNDEQEKFLADHKTIMDDLIAAGDYKGAATHFYINSKLDLEEQAELWGEFNSKHRAEMKKFRPEQLKEAA